MSLEVTENESYIYNIIVEYLKEKRELKLDAVLPYLKHRLKNSSIDITNKNIIKTVQILIKRKLIVEGSRLVRYNILRNPKRKKIYRYIVKNPGVYHYEIIKNLNIASQVVIWHLRILQIFKLIKKAIIDNHEIYFEKFIDLSELRRNYYLRRKKSKRIIYCLNNTSEGLTKTKLSKILKMHPLTIKKYVNVLRDLGVLREEKYSNKIHYYINTENISFDVDSNTIDIRIDEIEQSTKILTESEIYIEIQQYICVVHKGNIEGTIYLCPECQTTYCLRCAKELSKRNEKCWSCNGKIKP